MGVVGLLALVFVGWLMMQTINDSDSNAGVGSQTVHSAPKPDKQPPLDK
jgi:hypothetical protein